MPSASDQVLLLEAVKLKDLPAHPELAEQKPGSTIGVAEFIERTLDAGLRFVDVTIPDTFKSRGIKASSPSTAKVDVLAGRYPAKGPEWFGRRSIHDEDDSAGTATYLQFDGGLRKDHSLHEQEYTPNIFDASKLLEWDCSEVALTKYTECSIQIWEMYHGIPFPFENRIFNTLVVSAKYSGQGFIVVQLPVDKPALPAAVLERSLQDPATKKYRTRAADGAWKLSSPLTEGMYTSVERVLVGPLPSANDETAVIKVGENQIMWEMATVSDAKGRIPSTMQKMAIPGQIAKDVGLFLGWVERNRRNKKPAA